MTYTSIQNKKGFTLIELLIVIGILAVLATITVLVLNPAQLFAQARDSQRLSDLDTIRNAIVYVQGTASTVTALVPGPFTTVAGTNACNLAGGAWTIYSNACTVNAIRLNDGTGWVGATFTDVSPAPLATLPIDPTNTASFYYTYKGVAASGLFKLGAVLESTKYSGLMTTDGGSATSMYEVGTAALTPAL